jgi:hypothetical protein
MYLSLDNMLSRARIEANVFKFFGWQLYDTIRSSNLKYLKLYAYAMEATALRVVPCTLGRGRWLVDVGLSSLEPREAGRRQAARNAREKILPRSSRHFSFVCLHSSVAVRIIRQSHGLIGQIEDTGTAVVRIGYQVPVLVVRDPWV